MIMIATFNLLFKVNVCHSVFWILCHHNRQRLVLIPSSTAVVNFDQQVEHPRAALKTDKVFMSSQQGA